MSTHADTLLVSDYVICATLRKVPNVFNVELLWERVRGGQEGVFLLEALKRYPRAPHGRQRKQSCYSHVVVRIPERDFVSDDRLDESVGRETLLRELHRLHEQELGGHLAEEAAIRYRVEADTVLRPGSAISVWTGRLSSRQRETPLFHIQAASEGGNDWRALGPIYAC